MKKIYLMLMVAPVIGFSSCDNDFDFPNPPGQSNPQESIFNSADLDIASSATGLINLEDINNADGSVKLAEIASLDSVPAGYTLAFDAQMSSSADFSNALGFEVTVDSTAIVADPDILDATFHEVFNTIDPKERTAYIRYKAYAVNGTNKVRIGGQEAYYGSMEAQLKPFDPGFVAEDTYYIIGTATDGKIDASKAVKMTNSGISPYDDPVFSAVIDITGEQAAEGYEWAVVPASTLAAGSGVILAPSSEELVSDATGYFKEYNSIDLYGLVYESNNHLFTINVRPDADGLYSYTVELAIPNLWTPGPANGWSHGSSQMLFTDDYKNYKGFVHIDGEFKFTSAADWNHTNFGFASAGKLSNDGGAGNIKETQAGEALVNGLYWCTANITALTYTTTPITSIGIIGDATANGWNGDTAMTPSADFLTWTVTTTLGEGEFKFRANNDWAINLGGSFDNLVPDGANLRAGKTGEVTIVLDLSSIPYTATVK